MAQLYRSDVPSLAWPGDHDLLQVLWCPFDAHGGLHQPAVELRWRRSDEVGEGLGDQPEPEVVGSEGYVPSPCVLHPEQVTEYRALGELPGGLRERIEAWEGDEEDLDEDSVLYQSDLSVAPGWKAGGFFCLAGDRPGTGDVRVRDRDGAAAHGGEQGVGRGKPHLDFP
ncbi:hypothetical protein ACIF9R_33360 [Streptomyces sp. NPDC086080]|uniref:hypothetical protein n=1 Tax=Streptomyces sp. NPDC086080 TaxID=3365748 RepID=UPI0037D3A778